MARSARIVSLLLLGVSVWAGLRRAASVPAPSSFRPEPTISAGRLDAGDAARSFASSGATPSVHSATAIETADGRVRAFWYGGSREGAKDVAIYSALFDPERGAWGPEELVVSRRQTRDELGRYIRKLGNPVAARDAAGRLWLFYVSVSFGGWSGSAINVKISEDDGRSFGPARRLVTSPMLNVSTLVRGPVVEYADGTLGLPVYHELIGKFGELLRLGPDASVLGKTRLSWGRTSLQPVVVPLSGREAVALFRSSGESPRRVLVSRTEDAGRTWSPLAPSSLPNPDAAVASVRAGRDLLVAYNDSEIDRSSLAIARSSDGGRSFEPETTVPEPGPSREGAGRFAYPWLLHAEDGALHLLYTWERERIAHVWFRP